MVSAGLSRQDADMVFFINSALLAEKVCTVAGECGRDAAVSQSGYIGSSTEKASQNKASERIFTSETISS